MPVDAIPVEGTGLVMLQEEPTEGFGSRTDANRARAGELRLFAYNLVRAGAQAVLTLPALPDLVVPDVLGVVASAPEGESLPSVTRLLDAAGAARRQISLVAKGSELPPEADESGLLESALDVCVFVRSEREPDLDSAARVPEQDRVQGSVTGLKI